MNFSSRKFFCSIFSTIIFNNLAVSYTQRSNRNLQLISLPDIRLTKWLPDTDRDYIDEIWDSEWNNKIDTEAILTTGFGSHEYVVSQHVAAIFIECHAPYPVEWEFNNAYYVTEDLHEIQLKTFRHSKNVLDSTTDTFSATLEISTESNRATGNYSCRSTQNPPLANDVYIYWEGTSPPYLVLAGKVVDVGVHPKMNSVVIPCYVSHPTISVYILKEINGLFKQLSNDVSAKFDPKIGFEVSFSNISDVTGRYRCLAGDDGSVGENDVMEAFVQEQTETVDCKGADCFHNQNLPGTSLYFNEKTEELICCGKHGSKLKPPRLHTIFCESPSSCRMLEPAMYLTTGSNGRKSVNGSCVSEKLFPRDFGLVRCNGDGIDVFTYVYTEFWTPEQEYLRAVFDWNQLNPKNMIHLMIHASTQLYNNQLVTATCQTLHSYYSDGIKWAIKWNNGSMVYFDSILSTESDSRLHGIRSTYLRLRTSMIELVCFAPVWNSTKWVEKSLKLDVKPSRRPVVVGEAIEELTFSLNDTEKILECVSNAEPPAKIKWTRNDEDVPRSMVIWNENGTSVLLFKRISYQTHGVYGCVAKNEVGLAKKIFRVFVEDTRHSAWSTAFAVVIPMLVIVFVGVFAFLMWKMQLQKKVVDHLTRVVFRETNNT